MTVRDSWFDGNGFDLVDSFVQDRDAQLEKYLGDGVVSKEEWLSMRHGIFEQLKTLEKDLSDELHAKLTTILRDYDLLLWMTRYAEEDVISWCTPLQDRGKGIGCPDD